MDNKTTTIIAVIIVLLVIGGGIWYWMGNGNQIAMPNQSPSGSAANTDNGSNTDNGGSSSATGDNKVKGTMYFSLTDAAVNMGSVTAVDLTIDKIQAYNKVNGWLTVSTPAPLTFNLLDLKAKGQTVLLAKTTIPANTYSQFRIHIAKVMVTASGKTTQAALPAQDFTVTSDLVLNPNTASTVQFDVLADKSLHQTAKGEYIFAPVIKFDSRMNATVKVNADNTVSVSFGQTNAGINLGMDVDGKIKTDFVIPQSANLTLDGGVIKSTTVLNVVK